MEVNNDGWHCKKCGKALHFLTRNNKFVNVFGKLPDDGGWVTRVCENLYHSLPKELADKWK